MKINNDNWDYIELTKLYKPVQETTDNQAQKLNDGDIPLVSSGKTNNGIVKRIDNPVYGSTLFPIYTITLDMFGKAFLQTEPFFAVSHARVTMLIPLKEELKNRHIGLFLVSVLSAHFSPISSYNSMCGKKRIEKESIMLPMSNSGSPDWDYMENYMKSIEERCKGNLNVLKQLLG